MRSFALRNNLIRGGAAVLASSAIVLAVAAPGSAATTPLAYADANALTLNLLGSPLSTGTVVSTTDGKTTTTSGNTAPTIQALGNQNIIPTTAVLAQGSNAHMNGLMGVSSACAGLAGGGSGFVLVGGQATCTLTGGVAFNAGSVNLTNLAISNAGALAGLTGPIQAALQPLLTPVLSAVSSSVLTPLASAIPISVQLGAVNASCQATPTTATGNGSVAGLAVVVNAPAPIGTITIPLSIGTGKNVHVLTNLDKVVQAIQTGLVNTLDSQILGSNSALATANVLLNALGTSVNQLLGTINTNVIAVIAPQLAPLEQNILDGVINAQSQTAAPHPTISVTALDLKVLPILGSNNLGVRVGKVDCGPNYDANATCQSTNTCPPPPCQALHNCPPPCQVTSTHPCPPPCQALNNCPPPHKVTSGLAAGYLPTGPLGMALLGFTVVAAAGAGVTAGARALRKSA